MQGPQFAALRRELRRKLAKATNMAVEGLLSEMKAAVPFSKRAPHAEKMVFLSHLGQIMKNHLAAGRKDCRAAESRETLIEQGAPVEGRTGPTCARPDSCWRNHQFAPWRRDNPEASQEDAIEFTATLAGQWWQASEEERAAMIAVIDASVGSEPDLPDVEAPLDHGPSLWDVGDEDLPVREEVLRAFLHSHLDHAGSGFAGIARKAAAIRKAERDALIVRDSNDIPASRCYQHRLSCHERHPGLCAYDDADVYDDALLLAKSLENCLLDDFVYKYFKIYDRSKEDGCWGLAHTHEA
jgi:hypothetical protein